MTQKVTMHVHQPEGWYCLATPECEFRGETHLGGLEAAEAAIEKHCPMFEVVGLVELPRPEGVLDGHLYDGGLRWVEVVVKDFFDD